MKGEERRRGDRGGHKGKQGNEMTAVANDGAAVRETMGESAWMTTAMMTTMTTDTDG